MSYLSARIRIEWDCPRHPVKDSMENREENPVAQGWSSGSSTIQSPCAGFASDHLPESMLFQTLDARRNALEHTLKEEGPDMTNFLPTRRTRSPPGSSGMTVPLIFAAGAGTGSTVVVCDLVVKSG